MVQLAITSMLLFFLYAGPAPANESYQWKKVREIGSGCFPPNFSDGQFAMAIKPVAGFDNKLFLVAALKRMTFGRRPTAGSGKGSSKRPMVHAFGRLQHGF